MEKTLIEPQRPVGQYYANNIHVISVLKRRRKAQWHVGKKRLDFFFQFFRDIVDIHTVKCR